MYGVHAWWLVLRLGELLGQFIVQFLPRVEVYLRWLLLVLGGPSVRRILKRELFTVTVLH